MSDKRDGHWAHTDRSGGSGTLRVHDLREHLNGTERRAREFAEAFDSAEWAAIAGRWHDLGKYSRAFQDYLRESSGESRGDGDSAHLEESPPEDERGTEKDTPQRKRVDHSTAGAQHALEWAAKNKTERAAALAQSVAFAIAGHHAGLADQAALAGRMRSRGAARFAEVSKIAPNELLERAVPVPPGWAERLPDEDDNKRRWEFWTRMLFSALCDADFLDTEEFFDGRRAELRENARSLEGLADVLGRAMNEVEARVDKDNAVQWVRREVRAACVERASLPPGFFTLTVPTGGGKTLASLTFAIEHARRHGLRRVVTAIPFTSITEQTADAFRAGLGGDLEGTVIEHHSAFDDERLALSEDRSGTMNDRRSRRRALRETVWNRLASENWDAPIVVTTTVQLFESLFARRTSRCRKLHRLARSVVVLDEAQTVPARLLLPIIDALKTLVRDYGATVVLCTATQPAWGTDVLGAGGIAGATELSPDRGSFEVLRRVRVTWPDAPTPTPYDSLAKELAREGDVLAIVHRRADARTLVEAVDRETGEANTVHLSALLCPAHRREVLRSIRERKARREPVRAVATQLVEAGVDLDFAKVYRALAGIDAMAQAAGRCNREGLLGREGGELRVFVAETEPPPGILQRALGVSRTLWAEARQRGRSLDLFDPETYRRYFEALYRGEGSDLDAGEVQALRASWRFEAVADAVKLIDEWAQPVVVPYGDAEALITNLERSEALGLPPPRGVFRKLQSYSVNVPRRQVAAWVAAGTVRIVRETIVQIPAVFAGAYDKRFGLDVERVGDLPPEVGVL
ncbi:MAG: CRISPR-associated endonuclease Cas3'' [Deltaproteobacteria bacterium]|nr:CRISPR-associated endonuclease Cas3'' [Deltaproteobacteria bacterium]